MNTYTISPCDTTGPCGRTGACGPKPKLVDDTGCQGPRGPSGANPTGRLLDTCIAAKRRKLWLSKHNDNEFNRCCQSLFYQQATLASFEQFMPVESLIELVEKKL